MVFAMTEQAEPLDYPMFLRDDGSLMLIMPEYDPDSVMNIDYEFDDNEECLHIVFKHTDERLQRFPAAITEYAYEFLKNAVEGVEVVHPDGVSKA